MCVSAVLDSWSLSHLGYLYPGTSPVIIKLDHNWSCLWVLIAQWTKAPTIITKVPRSVPGSTRVITFRGVFRLQAEDDELWTRQLRLHRSHSSRGHISIVECVMTFDCPPGGQPMVEIEGNLLTPNHVISRGEGEWCTAGALACFDPELPCTLATWSITSSCRKGDR